MPFESEIPGFEVDPMPIIEILTFPESPRLNSKQWIAISLSPAANGIGKVLQHEYHLDVHEDAVRWMVPIDPGMEHIIESALLNGESPTLAIFKANTGMLDRLKGTAPPLHSAIVQHQINQTVPPSPLPPPAPVEQL